MTQYTITATNGHETRFGEVQYYFRCKIQAHVFTLAVISVYSEPDLALLKESAGTVVACRYRGDLSLVVIDFTSIVSVVGMVPHNFPGLDVEEDWRYVVEKPGLDVLELGGAYSSDNVDSET